MSIYNPPSKTQGIFNPSTYGGLGAGGEITIDYLKSSFLEFPVAQGNITLVGTSVLGRFTIFHFTSRHTLVLAFFVTG